MDKTGEVYVKYRNRVSRVVARAMHEEAKKMEDMIMKGNVRRLIYCMPKTKAVCEYVFSVAP